MTTCGSRRSERWSRWRRDRPSRDDVAHAVPRHRWSLRWSIGVSCRLSLHRSQARPWQAVLRGRGRRSIQTGSTRCLDAAYASGTGRPRLTGRSTNEITRPRNLVPYDGARVLLDEAPDCMARRSEAPSLEAGRSQRRSSRDHVPARSRRSCLRRGVSPDGKHYGWSEFHRPDCDPPSRPCQPMRADRPRRKAMAIWQDLVDAHGFAGAYASVWRFLLDFPESPRRVLVQQTRDQRLIRQAFRQRPLLDRLERLAARLGSGGR